MLDSNPSQDRSTGPLDRLLVGAGRSLLWERVWRAAALPLCIIALFLAVSWLGAWVVLPPAGRLVGVGLFALALLASLWPLARLARPSRTERLSRIDRDAGAAHRPALTADDRLAAGTEDPASRALWALHRARSAEALSRARTAPPRPHLAGRDPRALRIAAALGALAALTVAGPEWHGRLRSAFAWGEVALPASAFRVDGWIDPPAYTRLAPTMLALQAGSGETRSLTPPAGSVLVVRASGPAGASIEATGGLTLVEAELAATPGQGDAGKRASSGVAAPTRGKAIARPDTAESVERRWTIQGPGSVTVRRGGIVLARVDLAPVPDRAPTVTMTAPPAGARGQLTLAYKFEDDYGIASAEARIERVLPAAPARAAGAPAREPRPLVPAPQIPLALPAEPGGLGEGQTVFDLSDHPWGGARVRVTVAGKDEAGQEGAAEPAEMTLPQRAFTKPLARALVELRRTLVLDANERARVASGLDALMIAPERFTPQSGTFLGLRTAAARLSGARSDEQLIEVADYLWEIAVRLEDGDLSQSERDLRAAQDALREALERGASEEEIRKLTQDLRAALDNFMRELAEQMRRDGQNPDQTARADPNARTIRPQDLRQLLDRMEQAARSGAREEAQRLLEQLRSLTENLQAARPGQRQQDQATREMNRQMDELDKMIREQQALRDETFRQGQERRGNQQNQRGNQQGQRGQQQGQRGQQPGQRGQQPGQQGQGEEPGEGEGQQPGQGQGQSLAERQQALRDRLEQLKQRMKQLGMNGEQGLDDADSAMGEAQGALGGGREGQAVDAQGRALESLRRGAQGLAQQMQQGMGEGAEQADGSDDGSPGRPGQRNADADRDADDPLGRNTRGRDSPESRVKVPGRGETGQQRAARVLEELRRRMGDPSRTEAEIDYLRRLLAPY